MEGNSAFHSRTPLTDPPMPLSTEKENNAAWWRAEAGALRIRLNESQITHQRLHTQLAAAGFAMTAMQRLIGDGSASENEEEEPQPLCHRLVRTLHRVYRIEKDVRAEQSRLQQLSESYERLRWKHEQVLDAAAVMQSKCIVLESQLEKVQRQNEVLVTENASLSAKVAWEEDRKETLQETDQGQEDQSVLALFEEDMERMKAHMELQQREAEEEKRALQQSLTEATAKVEQLMQFSQRQAEEQASVRRAELHRSQLDQDNEALRRLIQRRNEHTRYFTPRKPPLPRQ